MTAIKRRCTANPDLQVETIFMHLQHSSAIGLGRFRRYCQPRSPDRLFKGDGKQVLFGSFPSLISSIHSNDMEDFLQKRRAMGDRLVGHVLHTPTLSQRSLHHLDSTSASSLILLSDTASHSAIIIIVD
ncbi:hypothetical protein E4T49_06327 [Aureobasidium sp. EXF-10728]|nr:hypothetical protein E4T49_06327 [Aureobasidium sp. EXF-10728]